MTKRIFEVILMLLCMVSVAIAGESGEGPKARSHAWIKAFNAGDIKALTAIYATDGTLLPPNAEFVKGRKSIEAYWAQFIEGVQGELEIQETLESGDLAYLLGTFKIVNTKGKIVDRGKYVEIWKRKSGQWELYRDIWNTSLPPLEPTSQ